MRTFKNDWYVRMPANPPLVDPKVEMLPLLHAEDGDTLEPALPLMVSFLTEMGR